jgi:alpha-L-rhamnosidase
LGWVIHSDRRAERQTAYQVLAASTEEKLQTGEADLWDSGKIASDQSTQVAYQGSTLASRQRCYWKVRIWDRDGRPTPYSAPASWEIGLLSPKDWRAEWVGYTGGWTGRALYFRTDISIPKPIRRARAYIAGLGYYELRVNGSKVGDHVLDPGQTDYRKRVLYATYDVAPQLKQGKNAIAVIVGNGWYGMPKLLVQLETTYSDGSSETFCTHGGGAGATANWRVTSGPILSNSVYDGEVYDARLEKPGWDQVDTGSRHSYDRSDNWDGALLVASPGGALVSQTVEPIKVTDALRPQKISEPQPGVFVYDFGQNMAGWARLHVTGTAGTRITLRFAENLKRDGTVDQENLRKATATDVYTLKGGGGEDWEPRFTYHGFRYVQVEGFPGKAGADNLTAKVVRSALEPNGMVETSDELINRIQKMIWWTEASNLHSIPTDCPQRNERMGWMNDLTVRAEEAVYNFNVSRFFAKFLNDIQDTQTEDGAIADTAPFKYGQRPADPVSASYLLLSWFLYQHYGDTRAMAEHFDSFKAWTDFLLHRSKDWIVGYGYYGDWSPPAAFSVTGSHGSSAISKDTPRELMSTGYLYYCARLVSQMAGVLGKEQDGARYDDLARQVGKAFNEKYWNESTGGYGANNQAANSFALFLGLVPENRVPRVVDNLVRDVREQGNHLTTGNLCTKYVLEALTAHGRADLAFEIATQKTYPSWGFMLANGATTLWERWELLTGGGMNSHNHPMMGSVSAWFQKYLGGIQTDPQAPGFKRILIRPYALDKLAWTKAQYTSPYGLIRSSWSREKGAFHLNVTVPANTTAKVFIPARNVQSVTEGGQALAKAEAVKLLGHDGATVTVEVGSGEYAFASR